MKCLKELHGKNVGLTVLFNKETITIGSDPSADIFINDDEVFPNHAVIVTKGEKSILNVNSKSEVYLNSIRVREPMELTNGDLLLVGLTVLKVFSDG